MQPATTPSNQGYDAIARHYETSELTPDVLLIEADRDLRNSADFAALNSVVRSVQEVRGVSEVRGPTQPEGKAIPEFTLSGQGRVLADKLTLAIQGLSDSQPKLANSKKEFNGSPTALAKSVRVTRSRPKGPGESRTVWNSSVMDWLPR